MVGQCEERLQANLGVRVVEQSRGEDARLEVAGRQARMAMAESRKMVESDPASVAAQQSYYDVLKQKIQFLQDTLALMNMLRQGDAAGAAEIVDGGKS